MAKGGGRKKERDVSPSQLVNFEEMLDNGLDLNDYCETLDKIPIHYAALTQNHSMMRELINLKANMNVTLVSEKKATPIHICVRLDDIDGAEILAPHSDLSIADETGNTALHKAVLEKNGNMVSVLVSYTTTRLTDDAFTKRADGMTPLHLATELGLTVIANLLIKKGFSPDFCDANGRNTAAIVNELKAAEQKQKEAQEKAKAQAREDKLLAQKQRSITEARTTDLGRWLTLAGVSDEGCLWAVKASRLRANDIWYEEVRSWGASLAAGQVLKGCMPDEDVLKVVKRVEREDRNKEEALLEEERLAQAEFKKTQVAKCKTLTFAVVGLFVALVAVLWVLQNLWGTDLAKKVHKGGAQQRAWSADEF